MKLGELAQQKGQSEGIREFGEMLVEDHSKAGKKTAELAKDMGVIPPALPSAEQTQKHDALARLSGEEFDRQFAAEMVKGHQEEIAKYRAQAERGNSKVSELAEDDAEVRRVVPDKVVKVAANRIRRLVVNCNVEAWHRRN